MANGENVPPTDIESAILENPLFEQVMVLGEARPFLSALVVLDKALLKELCSEQGWDHNVLNSKQLTSHVNKLVTQQMGRFPGYARIRKIHICPEEWTVESGLITPTLKTKRNKLLEHFADEIEAMYSGPGTAKY